MERKALSGLRLTTIRRLQRGWKGIENGIRLRQFKKDLGFWRCSSHEHFAIAPFGVINTLQQKINRSRIDL